MTSKEFLKTKLLSLVKLFPSTTIKYYYDSFDNDHYVCISPIEDLNDIIDKYSIQIDKEFIKTFPNESLSFMEINNSLEFDELVYYYEPEINIEFKTINILSSWKQLQDKYFFNTTNEPLYPTRKIQIEEEVIDDIDYAFAA